MKIKNIQWKLETADEPNHLPDEVEIPKHLIRHICHKKEIQPDYNFLMGYTIGKPKRWWHGIEGITFIFMGAWNDSYIGYKDYAMNSHNIEDLMWDNYNYEHPAPPYNSPEYKEYEGDNFTQYMQENAETVFTWLDYYIEQTEETITAFLIEAFNCDIEGFTVTA